MVLNRLRKNGWKKTLDEFDITKALGISFIHVMAVYTIIFSILYLNVSQVLICLGLTVALFVFFGQGITLCYHRLLTHGSFKTSKWFRYTLTVIALCNWEGGPIYWVGNHRIHHTHSDHEGDPHSPTDGNWWAHMLWIFFKRPEGKDPWDYTKDLQREPVMLFLNKYFWLPQFVTMPLLYWAGYALNPSDPIMMGIAWVLWGVGVRSFAVYHVTWIINSICHLKNYGYTNFNDTGDNSRNNVIAGWLGMGEGYHNNHHAQERSAAHGMRPGEFDLTYQIIRLLEAVGLVWDVKKPDLSKMSPART